MIVATVNQKSGTNLKPKKAGATNPCRFGSFTFNMQVCTYLGGKTKMSHILWLISYDSHFIIDDWCSTLETFWNFKQNASPRAKKILNELIDRDPPTTRLGILLFLSTFGCRRRWYSPWIPVYWRATILYLWKTIFCRNRWFFIKIKNGNFKFSF